MTDTMVLPKTVARRSQSQSSNRSLNLNLVAFLDIDIDNNFLDELGSMSNDLCDTFSAEGYTTADDTATEVIDGAMMDVDQEQIDVELEAANCDIPTVIERKVYTTLEEDLDLDFLTINNFEDEPQDVEGLSSLNSARHISVYPEDEPPSSNAPQLTRLNSTASNASSSSDVAPMRCAMAKLANSIQRTTHSRNHLLLLRQQEMQAEAMQRRRNSMPIKRSSMSRFSSECSVSSHPTVVTVDSSSQCQSQVPSRSLSVGAFQALHAMPHPTPHSMPQRHSNVQQQPPVEEPLPMDYSDEYERMCSFYAPRRTSQHAQANHHNMHQRQPPPRRNTHNNNHHNGNSHDQQVRSHQQQVHAHQQQQSADQSAAYAAVAAISSPHPLTLQNHADFATGRRSTLTDSLDESRSKLVTIARQTGVGLMTAGTMAKWSVAARTTQGFY